MEPRTLKSTVAWSLGRLSAVVTVAVTVCEVPTGFVAATGVTGAIVFLNSTYRVLINYHMTNLMGTGSGHSFQ